MIHVIMIDKIENRWGNAWKKQNALFIAWSRPRFAIKCNKNTRQINRGKKQSCSPQVVSRNRHHQAFIRYWDVVSRRGGWISWISPICLISWCVPSLPTGVPWLYISNLIVCDGIQFPAHHLKDPLLSSVCVYVCVRGRNLLEGQNQQWCPGKATS